MTTFGWNDPKEHMPLGCATGFSSYHERLYSIICPVGIYITYRLRLGLLVHIYHTVYCGEFHTVGHIYLKKAR